MEEIRTTRNVETRTIRGLWRETSSKDQGVYAGSEGVVWDEVVDEAEFGYRLVHPVYRVRPPYPCCGRISHRQFEERE